MFIYVWHASHLHVKPRSVMFGKGNGAWSLLGLRGNCRVYVAIGAWDLFMGRGGGGGERRNTHVLPESRIHARIPASIENLAGRKGGGGGWRNCIFFYTSIGVGVLELLQVTSDKTFRQGKKDTQKEKKKKNSLARIFANILLEYRPNFARIRCIGKILGGTVPPALPVSYAYVCVALLGQYM